MTPATPCHNDTELCAFALGTDTEDEAVAVEGHLSACPSCLRRLDGLRATDGLLVALRCPAPADVPELPSEQVESLIARLRPLGGSDGAAIPGASQAETEVQAGPPPGAEPPAVHPLPEAFGRYRVQHVLGAGGMGAVYVAEDPALGRLVAVKVPRREWFGGDPQRAQARFLREARAAARVRHANVCAVHDAGTQDDLPYVVLDLIEGPSLHERLRQGPPVEPRQAAEWTRQLSEALAAVHAAGMSHRDVKPGNVLLAPDGRAVLSDFGVARHDDAEPLTADGQLVGTPAYMSPERLTGDGEGPRDDLYALGLVLYQMLAGRLPFDGPAPRDDAPPAPSRWRAGLDPRLDAIVVNALAPRPEDRYASARELADDLARYLGAGVAEKRQATVRVELPDGRPVTVQVAEGVPEGGKVRVSVRERPAKKGRARWAVSVTVTFALLLAVSLVTLVTWYPKQLSAPSSSSPHPAVGLFTLWGHKGEVHAVAFSPDGSRLASAGDDGTLRLWDARPGQDLLTLTGHTGPVRAVAYSRDGSRIASGGDKTVRVWDARIGKELLTLWGHTGAVNAVAFSPDGSRIASGGDDKTVWVWDARTGLERLALKGHTGAVNAVAFSPDGSRIASGGDDKTVWVWDARTGHGLLALKGQTGAVNAVAFSPDGSRLASGGDKTVRVWDARTGKELLTLEGQTGAVNAVAFSPDGSRLASGGDKTVRIWDARTGRALRVPEDHAGRVLTVAYSPDGSRFASGSSDGTVTVGPSPALTGR